VARVLVSSTLAGTAIGRLRSEHDVEVGDDPIGLGRERILARIGKCAALITLVSDVVDDEVLAQAPALRVVANCAVGVDNIAVDTCRRRGIIVTNTPDVLDDATADLTFALLLDACRRVSEGDRLLRRGGWRGFSPTELLGVRVTGATLGIVGLGRIGRAVAKRAGGFAMRILYTQRHRAPEALEKELGAQYVNMDDLLASSEIVAVCVPLTPETRGILSRERLFCLRQGAVVINTARGPCVDEEALADLLESGHLGAAGLDVFEREPEISPRLLASERAVLTPHIGSADRATREAMAHMAVQSVLDVLQGREPRFRIA
jgi:glyoxylate reductase